MKQNISIKTMAMITLAGVAFCKSLPAVDYKEDFSHNYIEGPLVGQMGWKPLNQKYCSPNITAEPGTKALHISGNPEGNTFVLLDGQIDNVPEDGKITLFLRASLGLGDSEGRNEAAFGVGSIRSAVPAMITFTIGASGKGYASVRPKNLGGADGGDNGGVTAKTSKGEIWNFVPGQVYEFRSTWNLAVGTATLEYRNVSADEKDFITLYSDSNTGSTDFPIGDTFDTASWKRILLRIGGDPEDKILGFSVTDSTAEK